jgi:hypothetical protein
MATAEVNTTLVGKQDDRFPMLESVWDFFSSKGAKTVFISVGSSPSPLPELDLAEMLGCPVHVFEPRSSTQQQWEETKDLLKTRKAKDESSLFAKDALKKWVLPRNIHVDGTLPFMHEGELVVGGEKVVTSLLREKVEAISERLGFSKEDAHIDLLKIDVAEKEDLVLSAVLKARFRPSLLLVRWSHMPDEDMNTMLTAAHLQTLGYRLLAKEDSKFLYYYTDNNYYELCSWQVVGPANPLIAELTNAFLPGKKEIIGLK